MKITNSSKVGLDKTAAILVKSFNDNNKALGILSIRIPTDKIDIVENIHLNARNMRKKPRKNYHVIIKAVGDRYQLLIGYGSYVAAVHNGIEAIDANIIKNPVVQCRYDFLKCIKNGMDLNQKFADHVYVVDISSVKITSAFRNTESKVQTKVAVKASKLTGTFGIAHPIILNDRGYLTDGYIEYLALKHLGVKKVYVTYDSSLRSLQMQYSPYQLQGGI